MKVYSNGTSSNSMGDSEICWIEYFYIGFALRWDGLV